MGKLGRACYWCMGGAWLHGGGAWVWGQHCILPGWWGCWIGEVGPEHWGLVLAEVCGDFINRGLPHEMEIFICLFLLSLKRSKIKLMSLVNF